MCDGNVKGTSKFGREREREEIAVFPNSTPCILMRLVADRGVVGSFPSLQNLQNDRDTLNP